MIALPLIRAVDAVCFAIVRLEHRIPSSLGETFIQLLAEADADLAEFELMRAEELQAP
jgi:hypothetical protein